MVALRRRAIVPHTFPCPPCFTVAATAPFSGTSVHHHLSVGNITNGDTRTINGSASTKGLFRVNIRTRAGGGSGSRHGAVSDTHKEEAARAAAADAAATVLPSATGGVAAPRAGSAAMSAARRRACRRKEDMCSVVGGAVAVGTGSVSTSMPASAAEAAVAVAPTAVSTVTSGEEEAARVAATDAVGIAVSSAAGGGMIGKWEAELLPARVPRWGSAVGGGPAPRWDVPVEERGRPSETEVICALRTRAGRPSETEAMGSPGARVGATS